jgi:rhodanese-related sulfurtransferase
MQKMSKSLMLLALAVSLVIGGVLVGGCSTSDPEPAQIILNLSPQQASDLIQDNANNIDFLVIDVRALQEFDTTGHIENAILIDYHSDVFEDRIGYLDRDKIYLIYCQTGIRSGAALAVMEDLGFVEVYMISDGLDAWEGAGLPVVIE